MTTAALERSDNLVVGALKQLGVAETLKATYLDLPVGLTFDEYEKLGLALGHLNRATRWWIGDWVIYGEAQYGEAQAQVAEVTGLNPETVRNYRWVCERVPKSRRVEGLSFSLHETVAAMTPKEQLRWLRIAKREGLSQRELRQRIRDEQELLGSPPGSADGTDGRAGSENGARSPAGGAIPSAQVVEIVGTTPSGLPNAYVVPGAVVRRIAQLAVPGRDGYMRVPNDLYVRLVAVLEDE